MCPSAVGGMSDLAVSHLYYSQPYVFRLRNNTIERHSTSQSASCGKTRRKKYRRFIKFKMDIAPGRTALMSDFLAIGSRSAVGLTIN